MSATDPWVGATLVLFGALASHACSEGDDISDTCGDGRVDTDEACDPAINPCCNLECTALDFCPRTCREVRELQQVATTGIYEVDPDRDGEDQIPVFCDFETEGGDWTLLYKKSRLGPGNAADLWAEGSTNSRDRELMDRDFEERDYASPLIGSWSLFSEVRVEVLTGTATQRFVHFDAVGTSTMSWFAPERHTASSWIDLPTDPDWEDGVGRFFSINPGGRNFYINNNWGNCPVDSGWLMVSSADTCSWERMTGDPSDIIFATGETHGNPNLPEETGLRGLSRDLCTVRRDTSCGLARCGVVPGVPLDYVALRPSGRAWLVLAVSHAWSNRTPGTFAVSFAWLAVACGGREDDGSGARSGSATGVVEEDLTFAPEARVIDVDLRDEALMSADEESDVYVFDAATWDAARVDIEEGTVLLIGE